MEKEERRGECMQRGKKVGRGSGKREHLNVYKLEKTQQMSGRAGRIG